MISAATRSRTSDTSVLHAATRRTPAASRPLARVAGYFRRSLARQLTNWPFMTFVIAMPTAMYVMFSAMFGDKTLPDGTQFGAILMTMMATYGGLGAAMHAGNAIQAERSTGWLRQLQLTPLREGEYLTVKIAVAVVVVIPAVALIYGVAAARGVHLDVDAWARSLALLLVALLPMVVLGIAIGVWFSPEATNPATTVVMLSLAMLGGLWFDITAMPAVMQDIARALPSYWANQLAQWPVIGGDLPVQGLWVLLAWTIGPALLAGLGYRRAVRTSRR